MLARGLVEKDVNWIENDWATGVESNVATATTVKYADAPAVAATYTLSDLTKGVT